MEIEALLGLGEKEKHSPRSKYPNNDTESNITFASDEIISNSSA